MFLGQHSAWVESVLRSDRLYLDSRTETKNFRSLVTMLWLWVRRCAWAQFVLWLHCHTSSMWTLWTVAAGDSAVLPGWCIAVPFLDWGLLVNNIIEALPTLRFARQKLLSYLLSSAAVFKSLCLFVTFHRMCSSVQLAASSFENFYVTRLI
jgi:hypothetical protein